MVVDRLVVRPDMASRLAESFETALELADGLAIVEIVEERMANERMANSEMANGEAGNGASPFATRHSPFAELATRRKILFSSKFACPVSGFTIAEIEPRLFSFNNPFGACPACGGLGSELKVDAALVVPDPRLTLRRGAVAPWAKSTSPYYLQTLEALGRHYKFRLDAPWSSLPEKARDVILYGSGEEEVRFAYDDGLRSYEVKKPFEGVVEEPRAALPRDRKRMVARGNRALHDRDAVRGLPGLPPQARGAGGEDRRQAHRRDLDAFGQAAIEWARELPRALDPKRNEIAHRILKEIGDRLTFLSDVGLDYLTLSRASGTLSGGESQRIRLASQIGSGLTGVLYVLDEPSIGLHQRDNARLLGYAEAPARTRQHRDRGRARRGRDPRRRLRRRHRARRGRSRRRDRRQGNAGGNRRRPELAHRPISLRRALRADPGASGASARRAAKSASSARAATT